MRNKSQTPNPFALNLPLCIEKRENDSKMCLSIIYNKDTFLLIAAEKYMQLDKLVEIEKCHKLYCIFTMRMIMLTLSLGSCPFSQTTSNGFVKALIPT